ncbi:MAG TPA: TolC family protein [Gemmatimonadaceae bacterium]|nr:TolC family protein [Gemmatimonadaceae bacterium]
MHARIRLLAIGALAPTILSAQQAATPLTLGDAARLAARQSVPALAAQLRTTEAAARVTQARSELLPTLNALALQSGHTLNTATFGFKFPTTEGNPPLFDPNGEILGPVNTLDIRARVTVPALDFAARERVNTARLSLRASEAAAQSAGEEAAASAATAYVRAARADAIVTARAADSVLADSLIGIARSQLQAGVGVALDVTRAQSQLAGIHAQLIAARGERSRARLELVRALGASLDAPIVLASPLQQMSVDEAIPSESEAVALALRTRPDLIAAQRALDAGRQSARAIRAERLPSIAAFGDDGAIGVSPSHLLNTYNWGIQLSLPVFDGFKRAGRVTEQEAVAAGLELERRELQRQVSVEVRSALLDLATAGDQVVAARERLRLAQQEYVQAQDRFRAGVAGNADVVTASLGLNSARNLEIDALASYQAARVALARAEGTATALP